MELKVVIDKKFAFMILGGILILAGAIYVNALNPAIFGHGWNEIDDIPAEATRWAKWGEIGNMPGGFADGVDNIGGVNGQFCIFKRTGNSCPSWAPVQEGMQLIGNFARLDDSRTGGGGHGYYITICCSS